MIADVASVYPKLGLIIAGSDIQNDSSCKLIAAYIDLLQIPAAFAEIHIAYTGKHALAAEGHDNSFGQRVCFVKFSFLSADRAVGSVFPLAVKVFPFFTLHLRTRILRAWNLFIILKHIGHDGTTPFYSNIIL